jgi:hypothetical protein
MQTDVIIQFRKAKISFTYRSNLQKLTATTNPKYLR